MVREGNPRVLSVSTLTGDPVYNSAGEKLGSLEDIVIDVNSGRIAYAVLSFGGILGIGDKLFAIPWNALQIDADNRRLLFDVPKEKLELAPGFDKNNWPDMGSEAWNQQMEAFYGSGTRYGSMAGSRMPSGSELRGGASLQSGSEGSMSGTSMSGSRAGTGGRQGDPGSRSALGDDKMDKRS